MNKQDSGVNKMNENNYIEAKSPDMKDYQIFTTIDENPFCFVGKYRRDLETQNWHYYEKENGEICHFRKEHMVAVFGDDDESIQESQIIKKVDRDKCAYCNGKGYTLAPDDFADKCPKCCGSGKSISE